VIAFIGAKPKNHFLRTSGIRFDTEYSPKRAIANLQAALNSGIDAWLIGCLDARIAKEAQVKFPQRKPLRVKRSHAV